MSQVKNFTLGGAWLLQMKRDTRLMLLYCAQVIMAPNMVDNRNTVVWNQSFFQLDVAIMTH